MISYLHDNRIRNRVIAANYLLDLSFQERQTLCEKIKETFHNQKENKKHYPIVLENMSHHDSINHFKDSEDFTIVDVYGMMEINHKKQILKYGVRFRKTGVFNSIAFEITSD